MTASDDRPSLVERVGATGMIGAGDPLVVAVSGGRDSLCLLDVAVRRAGAEAVLAVHVHHGLRGREADRDARRVSATAAEWGIAARVVRLRVPEAVRAASGSPVLWARDARREALRAAADRWAGRGTPVAVGHTTDDQAETVLLRAISSPGTRALAGMALRDEARGVVRPLLAAGASRVETGAWCTANGVTWCDDATNPTSPRGRVRAVLTTLTQIDPRAPGALVATADRAREDDEALSAVAAALVADGGLGRPKPAGGGPSIARAALATAPTAVGRRALRRLAEVTLGRPCPRVGARLEDVLALDPSVRGRAAADLGDGVRIVVEGGAAAVVRCVASPAPTDRGAACG